MSNLFRVITWKESGENEKCPKCLNIRQDFMEIMPNVWACYQCGCVFVPKAVRYKELEGKREQIASQEREKTEVRFVVGNVILVPDDVPTIAEAMEKASEPEPEFKCEICGKVCSSKLGLNSHMRSHKENK
jgi:hypothetical protein